MSVKIGKKIAEGACAEVYELGNNKVVKLAKSNTSYEAMKKEYSNNKLAWEEGLSVPKPYEMVDLDGRPGIVFERIYGETVLERFIKQFLNPSPVVEKQEESKDNETQITAKVFSEIHSKAIPSMSMQRESLKYSIHKPNYLTLIEKEALIEILNSLPMKQQLCHGDLNPNNILLIGDKPVVIDWMDASMGNPEADVAEYIIMIRYAILPTNTPREVVDFFNSNREEIIKTFMLEYTKLSGITIEEVDKWIAPIAARKLNSDGISEAEKMLLIDEIRRRLSNYK